MATKAVSGKRKTWYSACCIHSISLLEQSPLIISPLFRADASLLSDMLTYLKKSSQAYRCVAQVLGTFFLVVFSLQINYHTSALHHDHYTLTIILTRPPPSYLLSNKPKVYMKKGTEQCLAIKEKIIILTPQGLIKLHQYTVHGDF